MADLDRDRKPDIVVNRYWLKNGSRAGRLSFARFIYNRAAPRNAYIDVGDLSGDGRPDIVTSPAERAGQRYRLSWFQAPANPTGAWAEHVLPRFRPS